ncbi:MAG: KH domain-containing protein [Sandaracinus sp.]
MADERAGSTTEGVAELEELVRYVSRALVDEPDDVSVQTVEDDRAVVIELTVAEDDLGKVIGKDGRTARAIRTVLAASSARLKKRAVLEILE